jgi:sugar/nucleoside kinase (ribokinase family)
MQTYLGACTELSVGDVTEASVGAPEIVLLEGYVWDIAECPALMAKAQQIARRNGTRIALSLSDSFCVQRHRDEYLDVLQDGIDIVVADEDEIIALMQVDSFEEALDAIKDFDNLFAMTRSAKGSVIVRGAEIVVQPAQKVEKVVDTTGAGDAYTAGFLYGLATSRSLADCARLGTWCATWVIQRVGARIEKEALAGFE